ncbi:MAG: hypothetical protein NVSMB45_12730 [Ginsengibacter sp.]
MKQKLFSLLFSLFLFQISCLNAKSHPFKKYYVSNSGNDLNYGSRKSPFKSISKINRIHPEAGDSIFFKGGETFKGSIQFWDLTGNRENKIVITSFGGGQAIIDAGDSNALMIDHCSFIIVQKINFKGAGRKTGNIKDGVLVSNSKDVDLKDLDISGFQKSGLLVYNSKLILISRIFSHDNGSAGITVEGAYGKRNSEGIMIRGCRVENNAGDPTNLTNHSGNGIVVGNCKKVVIEYCTATNNGWDMPRIGNGPVGIWAYEADNVIIQYCLSYHNKTSKGGADGGGFDLDGGVTHSIVQYCFSYDNHGAGFSIFQYWGAGSWHDNIFRYNISEDDGAISDSHGGLYIWNSSGDAKQFYSCKVYNNIIYNSKGSAISFSEKSNNNGFYYHDNIFVGRDSIIKGTDSVGKSVFKGNNWWSLQDKFNIKEIRDIKRWSLKTGIELVDGKVTGYNIQPRFKNAGHSTITSHEHLYKAFENYELLNKEAFPERLSHSISEVMVMVRKKSVQN